MITRRGCLMVTASGLVRNAKTFSDIETSMINRRRLSEMHTTRDIIHQTSSHTAALCRLSTTSDSLGFLSRICGFEVEEGMRASCEVSLAKCFVSINCMNISTDVYNSSKWLHRSTAVATTLGRHAQHGKFSFPTLDLPQFYSLRTGIKCIRVCSSRTQSS
jgi:hypothetical protein